MLEALLTCCGGRRPSVWSRLVPLPQRFKTSVFSMVYGGNFGTLNPNILTSAGGQGLSHRSFETRTS